MMSPSGLYQYHLITHFVPFTTPDRSEHVFFGNSSFTRAPFSLASSAFVLQFASGMSLFWSILSSFPSCSVPGIPSFQLAQSLRLMLSDQRPTSLYP